MNSSPSNNHVITPAQAYHELIERSRELNRINAIGNLAGWDQQVYMPPGGSLARAEIVRFFAHGINNLCQFGSEERIIVLPFGFLPDIESSAVETGSPDHEFVRQLDASFILAPPFPQIGGFAR